MRTRLAVAAIIAGLVVAVPMVSPAASGGAPATWSQVRFDGSNRGANRLESKVSAANVATLLPAWSRQLGNGLSTPVVSGGLVYANCIGGLCAWDVRDGHLHWRAHAKVVTGIAVIASSVVFVVDGIALEAVDARTGKKRWRTRVSNDSRAHPTWILTAPIGDAKRVFVGTYDDRLVALSMADGHRLWTSRSSAFDHNLKPEIWTQPAFVHGVLYVSELGVLRALRATDGALLWRTRRDYYADYDTSGTPIVVGNTVYMSKSGTLDTDDPPALYGYPLRCSGICLPTSTAPFPWRAIGSFVSFGGPDALTFYGADTHLVAFDAHTGAVKWFSTATDSPTYYSFPEPVGANGVLYTAAGGELQAFDATGCNASPCPPVWRAQITSNEGNVIVDPVIADGTVFVAGNALYAYRLPSTISPRPLPPTAPIAVTATSRGIGIGVIDVEWTRGAPGTYRDLSYDVEAASDECQPQVTPGRFTHTTIRCTEGSAPTAVRVRAWSAVGPGPWSEWSNVVAP